MSVYRSRNSKKRQRRFVINRPLLSVDLSIIEATGVSPIELRSYLPRYILNPTFLDYGLTKYIWMQIVQLVFRILVRVFLHPRLKLIGDLSVDEVQEVYTAESVTYNKKHHLTTRGMDMVWRRMAGWLVTVIGRSSGEHIAVLDLCTGTGLTIKEMLPLLDEWGIIADITGLDYNSDMLAIAKTTVISNNSKLHFVKGNAMDLVVSAGQSADGLTRFERNSFDVVIQVCGIGGTQDPLEVFRGILQILKPGGHFFMIDMHRPIPEQPGEWPFFLKWCRFPIFEVVAYEQTIVPLVLNRLWAWKDTTICFYLLPLVTYRDSRNRHWGFKVQSFEVESQRWWLSLPLMPIGKIVVEKVEINQKVDTSRKVILESLQLK